MTMPALGASRSTRRKTEPDCEGQRDRGRDRHGRPSRSGLQHRDTGSEREETEASSKCSGTASTEQLFEKGRRPTGR
jgi:hypothetical protein